MAVEQDSLTALEAARARIAAQVEHSRAAAVEAAQMGSEVRATTAAATSARREVSVIARADGVVERIDVTAAGLELDDRALSALLTRTVRDAQRSAALAGVRRMTETLGGESPVVVDTAARVREQFPPLSGWR